MVRFKLIEVLGLSLAVAACSGKGESKGGTSGTASTTASTPVSAKPTESSPAASAAPVVSSAPVASSAPSAAAADPKEISIDDLLRSADPNDSGIKGMQLDPVDADKAPPLGKAPDKREAVAGAEWLPLPGNTLEIPYPKGWEKKKIAADMGYLLSPEQKALVMFTTFKDNAELEKKLNDTGKMVKVSKVAWKKPRDVQLGPDALKARAMVGDATFEKSKGLVVVLLVDTGTPVWSAAIGMRENDAPEKSVREADAVLMSMRKKR